MRQKVDDFPDLCEKIGIRHTQVHGRDTSGFLPCARHARRKR